ncbi:potassium channel KAT1-like [Gossypium australe]|uniref:Potassium channel KAT1-like n=1 Tax=Gossypium australe TaxID=47621 RepID=A0A5B6WD36_9ROSI|nr:potassium channel KAT1-like [Gossypium australe]
MVFTITRPSNKGCLYIKHTCTCFDVGTLTSTSYTISPPQAPLLLPLKPLSVSPSLSPSSFSLPSSFFFLSEISLLQLATALLHTHVCHFQCFPFSWSFSFHSSKNN